MTTVGIDVDGVVADLHTAWLIRYNRIYDDRLTPDDLTSWEIWNEVKPECGEKIFELITPGLYDEIAAYDGTAQAIRKMRAAGVQIVYVTQCFTLELFQRKEQWLREHGFVEPGDSIVAVGPWATHKNKSDILGLDWLVDDYIGNLENFKGYPVLQTRPHNRLTLWCGKRIKHLDDIVPSLVWGGAQGKKSQSSWLKQEVVEGEASVAAIADKLVNTDRQSVYGHPYDNHQRIVTLWNSYLEGRREQGGITPQDACVMMILLKVARLENGYSRDSVIDICGYAKCLDMIETEAQRRKTA